MKFIVLDLDLVIGTQKVHIYGAERWPRAVRILGFCAAEPAGPVEARRFMDAVGYDRADDPRKTFASEGAEVLGQARLEWVLSVDDGEGSGPHQVVVDGSPLGLNWA